MVFTTATTTPFAGLPGAALKCIANLRASTYFRDQPACLEPHMTFLALAAALVLTQAPAATEAAPEALSPAERSAAAAEKAAAAAQKAAEAAQRIADVVAPQPVAAPAAKPEEKKPEQWAGSIGAGLTYITGNSQTLTVTAGLAADRKFDAWQLGIRLSGAYGLANPNVNVADSTSSTTARRAAGTVRGDRTFGESFASIFVLAGSEFDHVKNIESRSVGEVGTGLTFFNQKQGDLEKLFLRVDLAARGGYETRFQYFPKEARLGGDAPYGVAILAPRAALMFRWGFSKDVRVSEELEFIPFVLQPDAGRLLINNTTKLNARLTETVTLATSLIINYDSFPPGSTAAKLSRLTTDVALTVGLEAAF
jgi:hypothetical protein